MMPILSVLPSKLRHVSTIDHACSTSLIFLIFTYNLSVTANLSLSPTISLSRTTSHCHVHFLPRIIHLRFQSMCKEYHRRQVIKQTFLKWRIRLMRRRADAFSSQNLQRYVASKNRLLFPRKYSQIRAAPQAQMKIELWTMINKNKKK